MADQLPDQLPKDPSAKSARFSTRGSRTINVSKVVPENIQPSLQETEVISKDLVRGVGTLIEQNRESYVRGLQRDVETSFDPEKAAINAAKFSSFQGELLDDVDDATLNASLLERLGVDDTNHPAVVEARQFFRRLGNAQTMGKPLARHTQVLAQSEMKKLIAANPLFEEEIRQTAKKSLGFDPTGSDVKEAFDIFNAQEAERRKPKTKTPFEKDRDNYLSTGRFTEEQASEAAWENLRIQNTKARLEDRILRGNAQGDTFNEYGNIILSEKMGEAMILTSQFRESGQGSDAEARAQLSNLLLSGRQRLQLSTRGADSASVDSMLARYDKASEQVLANWDNNAQRNLLSLDNEYLKNLAVNDISNMPGVLQAQALFQDGFADVMLKLSSTEGNPNAERFLLRMDPQVRGMANLINNVDSLNNALDMVKNGKTPQSLQEKNEYSFVLASIFTGEHTKDDDLALVASNASNSFGLSETLRMVDNSVVKAKALKNPKFAKQIQSMYTVERTTATQQASLALGALEQFDRTKGNKVTLGMDDKGTIIIQGNLPRARSGAERLSPIIQEGLKLQEAVARMNNIKSLTKTYSGQILQLEPNVGNNLINESAIVQSQTEEEK